MNILLVQPRSTDLEVIYPVGLAHVAAVLKARGHTVAGADLAFAPLPALEASLAGAGPAWVAVWGDFHGENRFRDVLRWLRAHTGAPIVVGGPYPSVCHEDLLSEGLIDVALLGEAEPTAADLARALADDDALTSVPGIAWRDGQGETRLSAPRPPLASLDELPPADREVFPLAPYYGMLNRRRRYTALWTSRGCDHRCGHCAVPRACGHWRARSAKAVVEEISRLAIDHGIREVHVEDDDFLADRDRALEIARRLSAARFDVIWQAANGVRADELDEELLTAMAESGCYRIEIGLESLDPAVAERLGRPFDPDRLARIVRLARRLGIEPGGYFILGLPGESLNSTARMAERARKLGLVLASFSLYRPVPGSPLYETADGRVAAADRPDVRALAASAARQFYLRPRTVPLALRYVRCLPRAVKAFARYRGLRRRERT